MITKIFSLDLPDRAAQQRVVPEDGFESLRRINVGYEKLRPVQVGARVLLDEGLVLFWFVSFSTVQRAEITRVIN